MTNSSYGNKYVGTGGFDGYMFELLDSVATRLASFGSLPQDDVSDNYGTKRLAYQGKLASSPNEKYAIFGSSFGQIFSFVEIESDSFKPIKDYCFALPDYIEDSKPSNDSYSVIYKNSCLINTISIASSNDFCFILCEDDNTMSTPKWQSSTIFVFDWDANPIVKIHLDKPLTSIAYNAIDHSIVGLSNDQNDNPIFVSYKLDILKRRS